MFWVTLDILLEQVLCVLSQNYFIIFYYCLPATVDNTLLPTRKAACIFLNHSSVFKIGNSYGFNTTIIKDI